MEPVSRRELVRRLRSLGFTGPLSGGRHQFMQKESLKVRIPNPHVAASYKIVGTLTVPLTLQPAFSTGKPVVLFEGCRLAARQIIVVQNWFEELKRRMAAGKKYPIA